MAEQDDVASMASAESLLIKVNSGETLSEEELAQVAAMLGLYHSDATIRKPCIDDVYAYVLVLGRAKAKAYRQQIEAFLESKDPYTISLVLEILCLEWEETDLYLERVFQFAIGVSWDEDEDARQLAIKVLGEYLASTLGDKKPADPKHQNVLQHLFSVFDDEQNDEWTRQLCYFALCRAGGKSWEEIPSSCVVLDLKAESTDIDWEMLAQLREFFSPDSSASIKADSSSGPDGGAATR